MRHLVMACLISAGFSGCTDRTYTGFVNGKVVAISEVRDTGFGDCRHWDVELETGSRINSAHVSSTVKPDLKLNWWYPLKWTAIKPDSIFKCPTFTLELNEDK